jgi:glutamyl-tRNA synthetase
MIITRIAPSPTGFAHVGTAYTALFNYAFARHGGGKFILRIEDTDRKRHVEEAVDAIMDGLTWMGISWDEGPIKQSDRLEIYQQKAKELVEKGLAYEDEGAIRVKAPLEEVSWVDLVHGKITFQGSEITDFVILKSDGYPTYNFGVVVDDIAMNITHVIRGEEHISNTPRQLVLYKFLGATIPQFAHHPTLRNAQRQKLSKRRDPVNLKIYQEQGYLPQALLNFLMLMGWSHPEGKEIIDLEEFVKFFDFDRVLKSGPIFDTSKLDWINGEYIRNLPVEKLQENLKNYNSKFAQLADDKQLEITKLVQERIKKLSELDTLAGFFYESRKGDKTHMGQNYKSHLKSAIEALENLDNWNIESLNEKLMAKVNENNFKTGDFFMDLRIAITGTRFTPPINESIIILGKEETLSRLKSVFD